MVQKLCTYHRLWKEGNASQIQQEISSAPVTRLPKFVKEKAAANESDSNDDDDDDDDEDRKERGAQALCNGHHEVMVTMTTHLLGVALKWLVGINGQCMFHSYQKFF